MSRRGTDAGVTVAAPARSTGTELDATSIMMYRIPKAWTNDGTSSDFNSDLSETDKTFIRKQYP